MPSFLANLVKKSTMKLALILVLAHSAFFAFAIGPHELAVLVNDSSINSITLADYYCKLRGIPECNIFRIELPEDVFNPEKQIKISQDHFTKYIWEPFQAELESRGLESQIHALVLSSDFPTTITTQPEVSITGAFFARDQLPTSGAINSGQYFSPLFVGPVDEKGLMNPSISLDEQRVRLGAKYPLPTMMLVYTGPRGMSYDSALQFVIDMSTVDYSAPKGTIYFETNSDVRTKCRLWQYSLAEKNLSNQNGVDVLITEEAPPSDMPIVGFMTGNRYVKPHAMMLAKGAFADHLTSFAAAFGEGGHTKITKWLEAGAGFSAGAVTEPYAIWSKFPSSMIFMHYLNGCTAIESFYLSVASPYQLLPLGDPLVKPWAQEFGAAMQPIKEKVSGNVVLSVDDTIVKHDVKSRYIWLVDGKRVGSGKRFSWDTSDVENGEHKIRLVVCQTFGTVRQQRFVEKIVVVKN